MCVYFCIIVFDADDVAVTIAAAVVSRVVFVVEVFATVFVVVVVAVLVAWSHSPSPRGKAFLHSCIGFC